MTQAVDSVEDAYLLSLEIATVDREEMSNTHKLTLRSSAKKTVTFELAMRERADTDTDPIEPSPVSCRELLSKQHSLQTFAESSRFEHQCNHHHHHCPGPGHCDQYLLLHVQEEDKGDGGQRKNTLRLSQPGRHLREGGAGLTPGHRWPADP